METDHSTAICRSDGSINCTLRNGNNIRGIASKGGTRINCTLRNGNFSMRTTNEILSCINCTLRNGNRIIATAVSSSISVLIVPCGMETILYIRAKADLHGINCTLRNGNCVCAIYLSKLQ